MGDEEELAQDRSHPSTELPSSSLVRDNNCGRWWASSSFPRRWSEAWVETRVGTVLWRVEVPSWHFFLSVL